MNDFSRPADSQQPFLTRKHILLIGIAAAVLVGGFFFLSSLKPPPPRTSDPARQANLADDALESAREALYRETDLSSCQGAIQQINVALSRNPDKKPPELTEEERGFLKDNFHLDDDEVTEVQSTRFTMLDAHYLDQCFLFRDAARSLELQGLPPAVQAAAAFAWVVRQVRLEEKEGGFLAAAIGPAPGLRDIPGAGPGLS